MHCHWIEARGKNDKLAALIQAVVRGFCLGYRQTANLSCRHEAGDVNLQLLRSALLFHGTEMISCAHEYSADSTAFQELFSIGVWYLRHAGKDMAEFAEAGNLEKLREEDAPITSEPNSILSLAQTTYIVVSKSPYNCRRYWPAGPGRCGSVPRKPCLKIRGLTRNPDSELSRALAAQGVEVVKADINDLGSVTAAFKGSNIIFAELETQQGIIMAKAASATATLEHYIWSTLPNGTKDFPVPHFEGKYKVNAFIKQDAALLAKTTFLIFTTYPPETPINFIGDVRSVTPFVKVIVEKAGETKNGSVVIGAVATLTAKEWVESWATAQGKEVQLMRVSREEYGALFPWPRWSEEFALMMDFFENIPATEWIDPGTNVLMAQQLGVAPVVTMEGLGQNLAAS
ncbi:hypothetical protein NLG97_g6823 [Lecanicillium saksenae]|uniref:Uncharacterized protein n=1 Tax=Lecanicillium saksenae TaxID=468837 RepID=A0ACC1QP36_9HYPO|nr:hypothetical protein NLG97_g6823 [Lecanicillium saksenae]